LRENQRYSEITQEKGSTKMATTKKKASAKKMAARKRPRPVEKSEEQLWLEALNRGASEFQQYADSRLGAGTFKKGERMSTDEQLQVAREWIAEIEELEEVPDGSMPDHEHKELVNFYFNLVVLLGAKSPFNLRNEMKRYIATLNEIKKDFPKIKKVPREDVQTALKFYDYKTGIISFEGYKQAITAEHYGKDFADMAAKGKGNERTKAMRELRGRVRSLLESRTPEAAAAAAARVKARRQARKKEKNTF
jgi:hypothetical protein